MFIVLSFTGTKLETTKMHFNRWMDKQTKAVLGGGRGAGECGISTTT